MTDYVSFLLERDAAKRRLIELFESETLTSAAYRSTEIVPCDRGRAARATVEKNNNTLRENRYTRTPVLSQKRTVGPTIGSSKTKRDLTVSSFIVALVLVGFILAAHTDRPVFWLLIGPTPLAVLHTARMFLRQRVIQREGLLMFCERDRRYRGTLLTTNFIPIIAIAQALAPESNRKQPNPKTLELESLSNASMDACSETIRSTPSVEVSTKENTYGNNNSN